MRADIFFFLAIFVFIFVAWVATGGPKRPISFAGPFITPVTNTDQEQQGYGNWWDIRTGGETNWWTGTIGGGSGSAANPARNTQRDLWKTQDTLEEVQKELQEAKLFGSPSPYKGKVSIGHASTPLAATDTDEEYLTLSYAGGARENVSISGWKLVSVRYKTSAVIPDGTTLLKTGTVNRTAAIVLQPGERAIVTTGRSPVGVSFRENACSGYLNQRQDFVPTLSQSCPSPLDDFERFYDGSAKDYQACKSAVRSAPRCETASGRGSGVSSACSSFMREYLTHNSCTTYHANDRNFWGRTWRVYLGRTRDDLWASKNDTIKLLDQNGLTVDVYSY